MACGDLPEWPEDVGGYRRVFIAPEYEWVRDANGFELLSDGVEALRVSEEDECSGVLAALKEHLRTTVGRTAEGRRALEDGFRYLIYRVGPYYVVPVQPTDVSGVLQEGHEIVNVFRAVTPEFVGDYLW